MVMNQPLQELQSRPVHFESFVEEDDSSAVRLTQIVDMTLTRRVPVSDFQQVDHVFIWLFEEGLGQRINRMAQRWLREGKEVTVLTDRILPLPDEVNVYVIAHESHAVLANGYIHKKLNEATCEGERCFSSSRMYTPYREIIRSINSDEVKRQTGLSATECDQIYSMFESANNMGHYFPHEEMMKDKIQQFRAILMIPLLELGCKRDLSLRVLIGEGKSRVYGQSQPSENKQNRSLSILRDQKMQKSGRLVFDFYSDEISDRFEVDPLPIG